MIFGSDRNPLGTRGVDLPGHLSESECPRPDPSSDVTGRVSKGDQDGKSGLNKAEIKRTETAHRTICFQSRIAAILDWNMRM